MKKENLHVFQLENGLKVIVEENHSSPVVELEMWVKVGSADEEDALAGISHVFEHMLFKGTERRPVGAIAGEVEALGGDINAFTSFDQTVYHITISGRYFNEALDILADAAQNSSFDVQELSREIPVVLEELQRALDSPGRRVMYGLFDLAYKTHPYRRPVIGEPETISKITRETLIDVFHQWYVPENMTLVVVGDVQTEKAEAAIRKAFKPSRSSALKSIERPQEPKQEEIRVRVEEGPFEQAYLGIGFHAPRMGDPEVYKVDVLMELLGSGESSRLYQEVKSKRGLVYSIGSYAYTPKDPGIGIIDAEIDSEKVESALRETLRVLYAAQFQPFTSSELEGARRRLESEFIYGDETVDGRARHLGYADTVYGSLTYVDDYLRGIRAVTIEDVQKTAQKLLRSGQFSLMLLVPSGKSLLKEMDLERIAKEVEQEALNAYTQAVQKEQEGAVTRVQFPSGMTLLVKEDRSVPIIAVKAVFLGGLRFETPQDNGINTLLSLVWTEGTAHRSAVEIARSLDSIAASIGGFSGNDTLGLSAQFLSQDWSEAWDLFSDILMNPTFPQEELEKKRVDVLGRIRSRKDEVSRYAFDLFRANLYPGHSYGMVSLGTEDSVQKLTSQNLAEYYHHYVVPQNLVISVVGDLQADSVIQAIQGLESWHARGIGFELPSIPKPLFPQQAKEVQERLDKKQAHLIIGFPGPSFFEEDRYPLAVLNAILSGQGGRLFGELRDKQNLAYVVTSVFQASWDGGFFAFYMGTSPEKEKQAFEGMKSEISRLLQEGVTAEEVRRGQQYLIGSYEIGLQERAAQASDLALNERYGLGWNYSKVFPQKIQAVTQKQVEEAAKKYIDLDRAVIVTVHP
ncbi:MAG: insulinase family protein [Deltaproteobacteria bacterium]|nr:insulinase family protein [Deltaproteobacteria bacterium]